MQNNFSFILSGIIAFSFYIFICALLMFYLFSPVPKTYDIKPTSTTIELDMITEKAEKKMVEKKTEKKKTKTKEAKVDKTEVKAETKKNDKAVEQSADTKVHKPREPQMITADISTASLRQVRERLPVLKNRRFAPPQLL